jgi:hypothetical protein
LLIGGIGDDGIFANDEDNSDKINCGVGTDRIFADQEDNISNDRENINPSLGI